MATTPPLPVLTEYRGPLEIQLRDRVSIEDIADGALRIVVQCEGDYYDAQFTRTDAGVQVYYVNGASNTVVVGSIAAYDGSRKNITLVCETSGLTIVDILAQSDMPEVVMYPSMLDENVENAIMLFREPMPKQAIIDGALEMYCESERWGNEYIYPNVNEQEYMPIMAGGSAYFNSDTVQTSNKNLKIYKSGDWSGSDTKFSLPNRLAWMEGFTLLDGIDGQTLEGLPEDVPAIVMTLSSDENQLDVLLSQSESKIVRSFENEQSLQPIELRFSGGLTTQTIFSDYPKPENVVAIPLRLELYNDELVSLFPLYAMRKNNYMESNELARVLKMANGVDYAAVGTPSPVLINVI